VVGGRDDVLVDLHAERGDAGRLVLEVEVEGRAGDTGPGRDVGDRHALEVPLAQERVHRLEQRRPAPVAAVRRPAVEGVRLPAHPHRLLESS
jgi:hypothetical protein